MKPFISARLATADDAPLLAELNKQLIVDEGHRNPMNVQQLAQRMRGWLTGEYHGAIFSQGGSIVGYALWRKEDDGYYLRQFYIVRESRRRGLGRAGIEWLRRHAWVDAERISLEVLISNQRGVAFWRSVGFADYCLRMEMDLPCKPPQADLVFLPATGPDEARFGQIPERIDRFESARIHQVRFDRLVWYNRQIRTQAIQQIRAMDARRIVLIGFSKSALGAWNIAREIPEMVAATVLFDTPATSEPRRWQSPQFYPDAESYAADLPIHSIDDFASAMAADHKLVLISGQLFADDMRALSSACDEVNLAHTFLDQPALLHHWNSGWIELGLEALGE
ncbi:MAG: GNAT family N-acetyltransferase [Phycisphaerae bacterium]